MSATETIVVRDARDAVLVKRFYGELYLRTFQHQVEPFESWARQLWGVAPAAYDLIIILAGENLGDPATASLMGGVVAELYPLSRCGLITYLVVAPEARRSGLGRTLLVQARRLLEERASSSGAMMTAVLGEVSDPLKSHDPEAWPRLERFQRWGARVVEHPYVQPRLGPGLSRDPDLRLIAFFDGEPSATLPGPILAGFLREFFLVTEGASLDDDPDLRLLVEALPAAVPLRALHRP